MSFVYDYYGNLKQNKIFLANPQKEYIGQLNGVENLEISRQLNAIDELSFKIYEYSNGKLTPYYDKIVKFRLIHIEYFGWFQIINVVEQPIESSDYTYKTVKCCALENSLLYKKVYDITGTFALYNPSNPDKSILHIVCNECNWEIGTVSNALLDRYRTFDIESMPIYNLLVTEVSESFGCVFIFDSFNKTISAKVLDEIGEDTNIIVSKKNILKEWELDDTDAMIITKLRGIGGDDGLGGNVDFRAVNFGMDYVVDLSYFLNTEWMRQSTINAWNNYITAQNNAQVTWNNTLNQLKTKQNELEQLNNELEELQAQRKSHETVMGTCVNTFNPPRVPLPSDSNYSIYQNALQQYNIYTSQISAKQSQITAKKNEIVTIQNTLNTISNSLNINNYLTPEQIEEISLFITEDEDFTDDTYVITDTMTEAEVIDLKLEFLEATKRQLTEVSHPKYSIKVKASNLFTIRDNKDDLVSYEEWRDQFDIGNIIHVKLKENLFLDLRLLKIIVPFDNPDEIELVFSNRSKLDDELIQLGELIADANRTATSYSLAKFGYKKASELVSPVREFINGTLSATLNAFQNNDNQEVYFDEFGLKCRKWLPDQNKYDDHQLWITNNGMLLTSDAWKTASLAIGLLTAPDGNKYYGIATEVLVGSFILGSRLTITNTSGTYTIDDNGFTASATIGSNTYSVNIKPNTPAEIFSIKVNNQNRLYINTSTNQLVMTGFIEATGGTLGNLTVLGTLSGGTISGSYISGGSINGSTITGTNISGATINGGTITGVTISGSSITSNGPGVGSLEINGAYIRGRNTSGSITLDIWPGGIDVYGNLQCNTINGYAPINAGNIGSQSVSFASNAGAAFRADISNYIYNNALTRYAYISVNDNFIGSQSTIMYIGSSGNPWAGGYGVSGWVTTSDERLKENIKEMDERYLKFIKKLVPKVFKMKQGTSGRFHTGFIAQEIEKIMNECGISDIEFAGLVKAPIYEGIIKDNKGNIIGYDEDSTIIDYTYHLRYEELIAPILLYLKYIDERITRAGF